MSRRGQDRTRKRDRTTGSNTAPPPGHPLRGIHRLAAATLSEMWRAAAAPDLQGPRAGDADRVLRALLYQSLQSIPNERALRDRLRKSATARWFIGIDATDSLWRAGTFGRIRARLFARGIAHVFIQSMLRRADIAAPLRDPRLAPDVKLLEAWSGPAVSWPPGLDALEVHSLLVLTELPDAMRHLPYLEGIGEGGPLETIVRRLSSELPGPLTVVCWSDAMALAIAPVSRRTQTGVLRVEPGTMLTQLTEAASLLHAAHLAIVEPAAALLPAGLLARLCGHHVESENDVTRSDPLPAGARAEIFSTSCLHRLRTEAPGNVEFTPGGCLDWAFGVDRLRMRLEDLRRERVAEPMPADLPRHIQVDTRDDWRRLATPCVARRKRTIRGSACGHGAMPCGASRSHSAARRGGAPGRRGCCSRRRAPRFRVPSACTRG